MLVHKMDGVLPPVKQLVLDTLEVRGLDDEVYDDLRMDILVGGKTFEIRICNTIWSSKIL